MRQMLWVLFKILSVYSLHSLISIPPVLPAPPNLLLPTSHPIISEEGSPYTGYSPNPHPTLQSLQDRIHLLSLRPDKVAQLEWDPQADLHVDPPAIVGPF